MSEQKTAFEKWNIERLEEMRVQHEMNPNLLTTKQAYINALEYELNAATAEANKRIEALESELADVTQVAKHVEPMIYEIEKLQASNNNLREALKSLLAANKITHSASTPETVMQAELQMDKIRNAVTKANEAISSTPAESLQAHDNETIDKCAKVVDHILKAGGGTYGDAIRALKSEVK